MWSDTRYTAVYIRRLTCALTATTFLALLGPAVASADEPNADLDGDKVTENLESHLADLPDNGKVRLIVSLDAAATNARVQQLERAVGDLDVKQRFSVVDAVSLTATKDQVRELADQHVVDQVAQDLPVHSADDGDGDLFHSLNDTSQASFGVTEAQLDAPLLDGDADGDPDTYSSDDMVAAVLDTGIDSSHVDLDGGKVLDFVDCTTASTTCTPTTAFDNNGHGTHVSATIAGTGEGDSRYRGVAPGAALVGVKVLDSNGDGFTTDVVKGIQWVVDHQADYGIEAINLSLGTDECSDNLTADADAVNQAWDAGLAVMAAAGNNGPDNCTIGSPGSAKNVVTVGAMADLGALGFKQADFSSRGPTVDGRIKPDISAPGVAITSAAAGTVNGYVAMNGTSMATPFVTGVALLMKDADSAYTNDDIKDAIRSTAVDWGRGGNNTVAGSTGPDDDYGAGRLDAYGALARAETAAGTDPALLTSPPVEPRHTLRQGSLSGTGQVIEYTIDVADTNYPVAATMINVPTSCKAGDDPDFDMKLMAPGGATVATADSAQRQDELGYAPTSTGVYRLRVYSFRDCGDFFVDVSGGSVSAVGTANPDTPKTPNPPPTTPTTPVPPPTTGPVATAALVSAARVTARNARARLRKVGLRLLLKRRKLTFTGVSAARGKVELAVRMKVKGKKVMVAKATRSVSKAGKPRLTVLLTRAGRRLLAHRKSARLLLRAAVSDATRRRTADTVLRLRR
jgi:serine protease AprX